MIVNYKRGDDIFIMWKENIAFRKYNCPQHPIAFSFNNFFNLVYSRICMQLALSFSDISSQIWRTYFAPNKLNETDQLIFQYSARKRPIDRKYKANVVLINLRFLFCCENSIVLYISLLLEGMTRIPNV